jgi:ADP-ribose pyrophosphatase YjhB (NUDIX family)
MFKFCPYCKSSLTKNSQFYQCSLCNRKIYINSSPAAGIVVIENGKFLISKRAFKPKKGYYDIVGGFLDKGEHPIVGAIRECKEETGLDIRIIKQIGIYIDKSYTFQGEKIPVLIVLYLAEIIGGKMEPQDDVASLHWFKIEKPPKKLAFPWLKKAMADLKKINTP